MTTSPLSLTRSRLTLTSLRCASNGAFWKTLRCRHVVGGLQVGEVARHVGTTTSFNTCERPAFWDVISGIRLISALSLHKVTVTLRTKISTPSPCHHSDRHGDYEQSGPRRLLVSAADDQHQRPRTSTGKLTRGIAGTELAGIRRGHSGSIKQHGCRDQSLS